jgi:predicted DCC family thiol-disulfide oxidoreductase YuxK
MAASSPRNAVTTGDHLLLYDGVCGLCNRLNQFVLPRDRAGVFAFASLQSEAGRSALARFGKSAVDMSTFYVVTNYRSEGAVLLSKAAAALFLMKMLGAPWRWLGLLKVLPDVLLNGAYDVIARNRYRLFGRSETCPVPTQAYRQRFLDL